MIETLTWTMRSESEHRCALFQLHCLQDLHRTPYLCTLNIYYRYDVSYSMYLMSLGLSWEVAPRRAAICNGALHLELRSF